MFDYRTMSFDGVNHTFTPSWAFSFSTRIIATCSADPTTCGYAAANGFGWTSLSCETAYEGATFSFDDPTFPD